MYLDRIVAKLYLMLSRCARTVLDRMVRDGNDVSCRLHLLVRTPPSVLLLVSILTRSLQKQVRQRRWTGGSVSRTLRRSGTSSCCTDEELGVPQFSSVLCLIFDCLSVSCLCCIFKRMLIFDLVCVCRFSRNIRYTEIPRHSNHTCK